MDRQNKKKKSKLEIIEDFSRHFCIVCHKKIIVCCGTPIINIGGCCSQIVDNKDKKIYVRLLHSHFHCYIQAKSKQKTLNNLKVKTYWDYKDVEKIVKNYYKEKKKNEKTRT